MDVHGTHCSHQDGRTDGRSYIQLTSRTVKTPVRRADVSMCHRNRLEYIQYSQGGRWSPLREKQVDFPFLVPSKLTTCHSLLHVLPSIPLVIQYAQTEPFLPTSHVL
ncbi:hypothetical protein PAMP_007636 [Pampus punctatissimus]